jgi:site-specific DNA-methyltransferase (adenine-specific)
MPVSINQVYIGDALELMDNMEPSSVDLVLTDPPYFLEKLDASWNPTEVKKTTQGQVIKNLPAGMKFDPEQGKNLQKWYSTVSEKVYRVLKPGGFFLSFSSPRLVHRMVVAVEDAGFYIRDVFIWLYKEGRAKGFSLSHFAEGRGKVLPKEWRTPQVRGNYEPIVVAQKPPEGTLLDNFFKYGTGLFNFSSRTDRGLTPSNVLQVEEIESIPPIFLVSKPSKVEREGNDHPTVKPVELLRHLIKLTTQEGAIVLDPFIGSGSTAVAAILENRFFIGFEINEHYEKIARARIEKAFQTLDSYQNKGEVVVVNEGEEVNLK